MAAVRRTDYLFYSYVIAADVVIKTDFYVNSEGRAKGVASWLTECVKDEEDDLRNTCKFLA